MAGRTKVGRRRQERTKKERKRIKVGDTQYTRQGKAHTTKTVHKQGMVRAQNMRREQRKKDEHPTSMS